MTGAGRPSVRAGFKIPAGRIRFFDRSCDVTIIVNKAYCGGGALSGASGTHYKDEKRLYLYEFE